MPQELPQQVRFKPPSPDRLFGCAHNSPAFGKRLEAPQDLPQAARARGLACKGRLCHDRRMSTAVALPAETRVRTHNQTP
jgi:hypothetical protein